MSFVFAWDMSAMLAFLASFVFVMLVVTRYSYLRDEEKRAGKNRYGKTAAAKEYRDFGRIAFVRNWIIIWVVMFGAGSLVSFWVTSSSTPDREATLGEAIGEYGLKNGVPYPLYLGGTQNSLEGRGTTYAGIFSSSAVIDLKPTTVVNIGFQHKELWWPLALPADKSPFKVTEGESSVTIWFQDQTLWMGDDVITILGDEESPLERAGYEAYWDVSWSDCKMEFHNLWLTCTRTMEGEKLMVNPDWLNQSIPDFFAKYFDHAQIDLTPEQHAVLFPTN